MHGLIFRAAFALFLLAPIAACSDDVGPVPPGSIDPPDARADLGEEDRDAGTRDAQGEGDAAADRDAADARERDAIVPTDVDLGGFDFGSQDGGAPSAESIAPARGALGRPTGFAIRGDELAQIKTVLFGEEEVEFERVGGELRGVTPPGELEGTVRVRLFDEEGRETEVPGGFTYFMPLSIDSVEPARAPSRGGAIIEIAGTGFTPETRFSFGGRAAERVDVVSEALARALTPSMPPGPATLRATTRDESVALPEAIRFYVAPVVARARPAQGPSEGGNLVRIEGAGFDINTEVWFGAAPATVMSAAADGSWIEVTAPAGSGSADVRAVTAAGDAAIGRALYSWAGASALSVIGVDPALGSSAGGEAVEVRGANVGAAASEVSFGGVKGVVLARGEGWVEVETPAGAPGPVTVTVTSGAQTASLPSGFTYVAPFAIDAVAPSEGDVAGGYEVAIEGPGVDGAARVRFGGLEASWRPDGPGRIVATAPRGAPGAVDVSVERASGRVARLESGFTYTEPLSVVGFSPARASSAGGTRLIVRGSGFAGADSIIARVGGREADQVRVLDPYALEVIAPPGTPGPAALEITRDEIVVRAPEPLLYFDPTVPGGGAGGAPIEGAVNISVFSRSGGPLADAFVMLSTRPDTSFQGYTDASGRITFSGAEVFGAQTVSAIAAGHSGVTVRDLDAENLTVYLYQIRRVPPRPGADTGDAGTTPFDPFDVPPPTDASSDAGGGGGDGGGGIVIDRDTGQSAPDAAEPPPGPPVYTGRLSGLNKLTFLDRDEERVAFVTTTRANGARGNPPRGPSSNWTLRRDGTYRIETRTGNLALIAVAGVRNVRTGEFRPVRMAVKRNLFAQRGDINMEDLELDVPLDRALLTKMANAPPLRPAGEGPYIYATFPRLDFGADGVYTELPSSTGESATVRTTFLPAIDRGPMAGVTVSIVGGAYTTQGSSLPFSQSSLDAVSDLGAPVTLDLVGISRIESSNENDPFARAPRFDLSYDATRDGDLIHVIFYEPTRQGAIIHWEGILPGSARSVVLPAFPNFSGLPAYMRPTPYPNTFMFVQVRVLRQAGLSIGTFRYSDLTSENWDAYSIWDGQTVL